MNAVHPTQRGRAGQRSGLCHVSVAVERLLALYGITRDEPREVSGLIQPSSDRAEVSAVRDSAGISPAAASQRTFAWFSSTEGCGEMLLAQR
jgi:hypothetical protein